MDRGEVLESGSSDCDIVLLNGIWVSGSATSNKTAMVFSSVKWEQDQWLRVVELNNSIRCKGLNIACVVFSIDGRCYHYYWVRYRNAAAQEKWALPSQYLKSRREGWH